MSIVAKMQWYIFIILRVEAFGTKKDDHVMVWSKKHLTDVLCMSDCLRIKNKKHFTQSLVENSSQVQRSSDPGAWMANLDQLVIFIHIYFQTHLKTRCVPLCTITFFFTCRWKNMLIYPFLIQNSPDFCIFVIFFAALVFLLWVLSCAEEHVHNSCSLHLTHKDNVRRTWNK